LSAAARVVIGSEVALFRRPLLLALVVFVTVVALGAAIIHFGELYPPAAIRPFEQGRFVGQVVGVPALILAVVAYLVARRRAVTRR